MPERHVQHSLQRAAFGLEDDGLITERASARARVLEQPVVIEVSELTKTFRVPDRHAELLKLRLAEYRELRALHGITFDVHKGEFFGIVGRNGSGKSTLLKILASIYRADSGRISMAGRLAPFIELGVGINPELTARENVTLNGVMMGLGRREAKHRLDSVLELHRAPAEGRGRSRGGVWLRGGRAPLRVTFSRARSSGLIPTPRGMKGASRPAMRIRPESTR